MLDTKLDGSPISQPESKRDERGLTRWVVEVVLILASVAVGFAASQFGQYREGQALKRGLLDGVREEIAANLASLEPLIEKHRTWQKALAAAPARNGTASAYDVLFDRRPDGGVTIGVPLRRAAWNTAVSSGALRFLDYRTAAAISEVYGYQDLMTENHNRLIAATLYAPATFDPASQATAVRMLAGVLSEIAGNEATLRALYVKNLPLIAAPGTEIAPK